MHSTTNLATAIESCQKWQCFLLSSRKSSQWTTSVIMVTTRTEASMCMPILTSPFRIWRKYGSIPSQVKSCAIVRSVVGHKMQRNRLYKVGWRILTTEDFLVASEYPLSGLFYFKPPHNKPSSFSKGIENFVYPASCVHGSRWLPPFIHHFCFHPLRQYLRHCEPHHTHFLWTTHITKFEYTYHFIPQ